MFIIIPPACCPAPIIPSIVCKGVAWPAPCVPPPLIWPAGSWGFRTFSSPLFEVLPTLGERSPSQHRLPEPFLWFWMGLANREAPAESAQPFWSAGCSSRHMVELRRRSQEARWQIFSHFYLFAHEKTFGRDLEQGGETASVWRPESVTYGVTPSLSPGRSQVATRLTPGDDSFLLREFSSSKCFTKNGNFSSKNPHFWAV